MSSIHLSYRQPFPARGRPIVADQREDWSRFVAALGQVAVVKYA
jgi:hypothetical protein